jgi:hypothetical protein
MQMKYDTNVFFFRDAAHEFKSPEKYVEEITKICETNEEVVVQLSHQIHAESVIIDKKFYNVKKAIQFFLLSFVFVILMMGLWVLVEIFEIF